MEQKMVLRVIFTLLLLYFWKNFNLNIIYMENAGPNYYYFFFQNDVINDNFRDNYMGSLWNQRPYIYIDR